MVAYIPQDGLAKAFPSPTRKPNEEEKTLASKLTLGSFDNQKLKNKKNENNLRKYFFYSSCGCLSTVYAYYIVIS